MPIQASIAEKQKQKAALDQDYAREAKVVEALPVKPAVVRKSLVVRDALARSSFNATPTLNLLRKALDSDIRLMELSFAHDPVTPQKPAVKGAPPAPKKPAGEDRGQVRIVFRFTLEGGLPLEQKVARTEKIAETMQRAFTGYEVKITAQFGKISRTGKFEGSAGGAGQSAADKMADFAEIEMQGAPL